jgi:hypothetical protein
MATTEPNAHFEGKVAIAVEHSVVHRDEVETPHLRSKSRYKNTDAGANL